MNLMAVSIKLEKVCGRFFAPYYLLLTAASPFVAVMYITHFSVCKGIT